jgi:hypothetical protein
MIICSRPEFKEAAEFYAEKLNIPYSTIIAVGVHPKLETAGYCEYHTEEALPYFLIGLEESDDDNIDCPISILAHEMVHVKQYVTGELIDEGRHCMWKGKRYPDVKPSTEEYYFSPWEIEAFGMQVGLYQLYCRSIEE